jgi:hypothetical protein
LEPSVWSRARSAFNGSGVSKAALTTELVVFYRGSDIGFEVVSGMNAACPVPGADLLGLTHLILGGVVSFLHALVNFLSLKQPNGYPSAETMHIFKPMSSRAMGALVGEAAGHD